jgi:N-acetylmuramoyl-L-alanine amidase
MHIDKQLVTPFYGERRATILIIHGTEVDDERTQYRLSGKEKSEASSHYYIDDKGHIIQYVDESKRAWHIGRGYWSGFFDINSMSIGIELMAISKNRKFLDQDTFYTPAQMISLVELCHDIITRHNIKPYHVLGHQDVTCLERDIEPIPFETIDELRAKVPNLGAERRYDPGPSFSWEKLAEKGIGLWHDLSPIENDPIIEDPKIIKTALRDLGLYGYDVRRNADYDFIIRTFQTHFLPWNICGKITQQTVEALKILLEKKYDGF